MIIQRQSRHITSLLIKNRIYLNSRKLVVSMSIRGLHSLLRPILKRRSLDHFKGERIGIDGSIWVYDAGVHFAEDIYYGKSIHRVVNFFLSKVKALIKYNIIPIVVFDGDKLTVKNVTHEQRRIEKFNAKKEVDKALKCGQILYAETLMKKCVEMKNEHLISIINALKKEKIEFLISPYESDAQLVYLQRIGYIDSILTEDGDLVVYGAEKVLYKFDGLSVLEYSKNDLKKCFSKDFAENIIVVSILRGCDYLKQFKLSCLHSAYEFFKKFKDEKSLLQYIFRSKIYPKDYYHDFLKALITFRHQIVYDPVSKKRIYLNLNTIKNVNPELLDLLGNINHESPVRFAKGEYLLSLNASWQNTVI